VAIKGSLDTLTSPELLRSGRDEIRLSLNYDESCGAISASLRRRAIEILNSRRNSHGPSHLPEKQACRTGPKEFYEDGAARQLVPGGLTRPPVIEFRCAGAAAGLPL